MRVVLRLSAIGLAWLLATAGVHAQPGGAWGNDTGGIIPWSCEAEATAQQRADNHCGFYGKSARITSVHRFYGQYIGFHCLWRADVARFQIPAVRTRMTCPYPTPGAPAHRTQY